MSDRDDLIAPAPTPCELREALVRVSDTLEQPVAWVHRGRIHFIVADEWTIAVSAESARRLRLDVCHYTCPRATVWTSIDDHDRLCELVTDLATDLSDRVGSSI